MAHSARTRNASRVLRSLKALIRLKKISSASVMPLTHKSWKKPDRA